MLNLFTERVVSEDELAGTEIPGLEEGETMLNAALASLELFFALRVSSDVSHFKGRLIVRGKVTGQCQQTTCSEDKGQPKQGIEPTASSVYQPNALLSAQSGFIPAEKPDLIAFNPAQVTLLIAARALSAPRS